MSARFAMRTCGRCDRQVLATADGHCPHCGTQLAEPDTPPVQRVTLTPALRQPHVCLQCGAPTHRRVRVRFAGPRPPARPPRGEQDRPWNPLSLVFGPFWWLIEWVGEGLADLSARRRPKMSLPVRQCRECARAGRPTPSGVDCDLRRMAFEAHSRYVEALARSQAEARRDARMRSRPSRGDDDARPISPS